MTLTTLENKRGTCNTARMHSQLLQHQTHRPRPSLPFLGDLSLPLARAHEFCGPARRSLALMLAARTEGPLFWISPAWLPDRLHGEGVISFLSPGRIIFVSPKRPEDLLWCMEEVLRTGAVPLVVADLPNPPGLTPVRRLHLAAENGAENGKLSPLGLLLTPGDGGAQGIESRWHLAGRHQGEDQTWQLERRRARTDPPKSWTVFAQGARMVLKPVSA